MPTVSKNKIVFDANDWLAGLPPKIMSSKSSNYLGNFLTTMSKIDPYRKLGTLLPGYNPSDVTNVSVVTTQIVDMIVNDASSYLIGGALLHKMTTSTGALVSDGTWPHTVDKAGVTGETLYDIKKYKIGTTDYAFYSYSDSTAGDIGRFDLSSTFDDDFMSTVPSGGAALDNQGPFPMEIGHDDILYIGDGNNLHAFDGQTGANGTLSKNVLTLPTQYEITSIVKYEPRSLVIFAHTGFSSFWRGEATAFFYNYLDNDPYRIVQLNDNYVTGGFNIGGTIGCFTIGRGFLQGGDSQLKIYNPGYTQFETVASFNDNLPGNGGVEVIGEGILWNSAGKIYQWSKPFVGVPKALAHITSGLGTSTGGVLKKPNRSFLVASTGTTTSGGLQKFSANFASNASFETSEAFPVFSKGKVGKITDVLVYFKDTASGGRDFSLSFIADETAFSVISNVQNVTNVVQHFHRDVNDADFPKFSSLSLLGSWDAGTGDAEDAPGIRRVEVYYDEINIGS